MEIKLYNKDGDITGEIKTPQFLDEQKLKISVVYEVVRAYLLNQRKGTASTKTRGEVSGGGRKPWRQKHTGNARAGSIRSPLWRKGGIVFGPKPKDWSIKIPKAKRRLSFLMALAHKIRANEVFVVEDFDISPPKTKSFFQVLKKLKLDSKNILFGDSKINNSIKISSRNIPNVTYKVVKDFNTYEVLKAKNILLTKSGYEELIKRIEEK